MAILWQSMVPYFSDSPVTCGRDNHARQGALRCYKEVTCCCAALSRAPATATATSNCHCWPATTGHGHTHRTKGPRPSRALELRRPLS